MFSEMIKMLKQGELPAGDPLRAKLKAALIKKGGVLQQPRPCWSGDPKINPLAQHMLWAAILLADGDSVEMVTAMLWQERSGPQSPEIGSSEEFRELQRQQVEEFLALAPTPEFRATLLEICRETLSGL